MLYFTVACQSQNNIPQEKSKDKGLLRNEGTSTDQSIFKAVFVPYAVNLVLDNDGSVFRRDDIIKFLEKNADTLWKSINKKEYPNMFCNFYWGERISQSTTPSMGAQVSGASLMESVTRMNIKN